MIVSFFTNQLIRNMCSEVVEEGFLFLTKWNFINDKLMLTSSTRKTQTKIKKTKY